jgi:hypothetical protein
MQNVATPDPLIFRQATRTSSIRKANHSQNNDLEICLTTFVRRALESTTKGDYSIYTSLSILDHAWTAQKLIWSLREQQD